MVVVAIAGVLVSGRASAAGEFYWVECDTNGTDEAIIGYGTEEQRLAYTTGNYQDTMVVRINLTGQMRIEHCKEKYGSENNKPQKMGAGTVTDALDLLKDATKVAVGGSWAPGPNWASACSRRPP